MWQIFYGRFYMIRKDWYCHQLYKNKTAAVTQPLFCSQLKFVHFDKALFIVSHFVEVVFAAIPAYHFKTGEIFSVFECVHCTTAANRTGFRCKFWWIFSFRHYKVLTFIVLYRYVPIIIYNLFLLQYLKQ